MRSICLAALTLFAVACGTNDLGDGASSSDEQAEEEIVSGVTRLASKLRDPSALTSYGDSVYFATTSGYATETAAEFSHDIWVKSGSGRAKRLYKGLYGATWGMVATTDGLYELNSGTCSIVRYPFDGSNQEGQSILHSFYEWPDSESVSCGARKLAADDDGLVVGIRQSPADGQPGSIVALAPDGTNELTLGAVPDGGSALKIVGSKVYVGTDAGDVFVADRSGAGSLQKVTSGKGSVKSIAVVGDDLFFGTDQGIFVKRAGVSTSKKLVGEGASELAIGHDRLLFRQYKKGVSSIPFGGGAVTLAFKLEEPTSILVVNDFVFVTDRAYRECKPTDEGQSCVDSGGSVLRMKL